METRVCKICGKEKPITEFEEYITLSGKRHRRCQCRECRNARAAERRREKIKRICPICKKAKQPFEFVRDNSLDYKEYGKICRECAYKKNREKREKMLKSKIPLINSEGKLYCRICKQYKTADNFYTKPNSSTRHDTICKECKRKAYTERYKKTKMALIKRFGNKCMICGKTYPWYAYDFHHKDSKSKELKISRYTRLTLKHLKTLPEFEEELKKCILVCAICHRKLHLNDIK